MRENKGNSENKRNAKKGIVALAMFLMIALVFGMGAMTYSKYITSVTAPAQSATAAKWGFVVTADASNMFGADYTKGAGDYSTVVTPTGVAVHADANVVAPGCTGSMTVVVNGSAEVLAKFTLSATDLADVSVDVSGVAYNPIKWTLSKNGASVVADTTLADLATKFAANSTNYTPGTVVNDTYTISWAWAFSGNDAADTAIGLAAAGKTYDTVTYTNVNTTVSLTVAATLEQVQTTA